MDLHAEPFYAIKSGQKDLELRLFDEKRQAIQVGDTIVFTNHKTRSDTLHTAVVALHKFPSFRALYESLPLLRCGYTKENIDQASPEDMDLYYSKEKQQQYGVVAIEINVL